MADTDAYKDKFSDSGCRVLEAALDESKKRDQNYVAPEHILYALAYEEAELFNATMRDLAVDPRSVKLLIEKRLEVSRQHTGKGFRIASETTDLFKRSMDRARSQGRRVIEGSDIFYVLSNDERSLLNDVLQNLGVPAEEVAQTARTGIRKVEKEEERVRINKKRYFAHETAVIDEGSEIGDGVKIWHFSHIMPRCKIGDGCNIGQNVVVSPDVVLGKNVKVQNNVSIYTGVICDDDVFLGPSMVFTNVINPRSTVLRRDQYLQTRVGRGASIGANATIVCGNDIGEFAFIGAGAVVTKEVPAYALVVGNPARQTGWMSEYGHRLKFDEAGEAVCPESGEKYRLENGRVSKI